MSMRVEVAVLWLLARYFRFRLASIAQWVSEANAELGSSVHIGAVPSPL